MKTKKKTEYFKKDGIVICGTFCENPQRFFDNNTYAQCTNNL